MPSGWQSMRVGIRLNLDGTSDNSNSNIMALGFCSGTTNIYGDATTTHFVGSAISTWGGAGNYHGGAGSFYGSIAYVPRKRVGTTNTDGTTLASNCTIAADAISASSNRYVCWFVDMIFGSPNYTIKIFYNVGTASVSQATWQAQMVAPTPVIVGHTYTAGQTIAVDEGTDGTLDSVNFIYQPGNSSCLIADLGVVRLT